MPRYTRCREKFAGALRRLAIGEGDVRERLRGAYWYLHQLTEHDIPPDLREDWQQIIQELTRRGPELDRHGEVVETALAHTLGRMRNGTGRRIAERIYMIARGLG